MLHARQQLALIGNSPANQDKKVKFMLLYSLTALMRRMPKRIFLLKLDEPKPKRLPHVDASTRPFQPASRGDTIKQEKPYVPELFPHDGRLSPQLPRSVRLEEAPASQQMSAHPTAVP
jgi:hypothetical protein